QEDSCPGTVHSFHHRLFFVLRQVPVMLPDDFQSKDEFPESLSRTLQHPGLAPQEKHTCSLSRSALTKLRGWIRPDEVVRKGLPRQKTGDPCPASVVQEYIS